MHLRYNVVLQLNPHILNRKEYRLYGVRSVQTIIHQQPEEVASAIKAVGISVERLTYPVNDKSLSEILNPQSKSSIKRNINKEKNADAAENNFNFENYPKILTFKSHDPKAGVATFSSGAAVYTVEVDNDFNAKLKVRLECGAKVHIDRILTTP